jgi:drug/metabolite transporter (DMT)-like permease
VPQDDGQPPNDDTSTRPPELEPLSVDTVTIVVIGTALFAVALVVSLLVPSLHSGSRDWWPWACLSGLGLGVVGLAYILRGRGNASDARRRDG